MTKVDWSQSGSTLKILTEGPVRVRFARYSIGKSGASQPKASLTFVVTEGDEEGSEVLQEYSLQPQSAFGIKNCCIALGAPATDFEPDGPEIEAILDDLIDAEGIAVLYTDSYGGGRTKIKEMKSGEGWQ